MEHADDPTVEDDEYIEVPYVELLALVQPLLRRFERTGAVRDALNELKSLMEDAPGSWSATNEAKMRLAALPLLEAYVAQRIGRSGALPLEEFQKSRNMETALGTLRTWLNEDLAAARDIEADLETSGVQLDPEARGGGRMRTGGRGAPADLLTEYVKHLLRERYPEWDSSSPFPGRNTQKLREWLYEKLTADPFDPVSTPWTSGLSWAEATPSYPFKPDEIDPANRGPLCTIISNLRRQQ